MQDPAPIIADLLASTLMPREGWDSARAPYCWELDGLDYLLARERAGDCPPINGWTAMLLNEGYPAANHGDKTGVPNPLQGKYWKSNA